LERFQVMRLREIQTKQYPGLINSLSGSNFIWYLGAR
jgi:hypothetical protein